MLCVLNFQLPCRPTSWELKYKRLKQERTVRVDSKEKRLSEEEVYNRATWTGGDFTQNWEYVEGVKEAEDIS